MTRHDTTRHSYAQVSTALEQVRWRVLSIEPTDIKSGLFEAILMLPPPPVSEGGVGAEEARRRPPPLVVVPHGGPHSCTTTKCVRQCVTTTCA